MTKHRQMIALVVTTVVLAAVSPATARTVSFSGQQWTVKSSIGQVGPGPNIFSDSKRNVFVDRRGRLHLRLTRSARHGGRTGGVWYSAEVVGTKSLGYGTYTWTLDSRVDQLDPNAVLGLFTWSHDPAYNNREIDIEFTRFGNPMNPFNAQRTIAPYTNPANLSPFVQTTTRRSIHGFTWAPNQVTFQNSNPMFGRWAYAGTDIPRIGDETPRMNLWLFQGRPPKRAKSIEVIIARFTFTPISSTADSST